MRIPRCRPTVPPGLEIDRAEIDRPEIHYLELDRLEIAGSGIDRGVSVSPGLRRQLPQSDPPLFR